MRFVSLFVVLLAISCATAADSADTSADTGTGDTAETGDSAGEDTAPACETVNEGDDWAWSGDCPQMNTPVVITVNECELTLDYESVGGMTMGMPYSGTVEGDVVTFANDNSVKDCVGTVVKADKITGSCKGGCEFTLRR
ncbi:hypothetical protein LBMAG42_44970 [Deltaproteobacteria bacterium]|nr:hypothetical protein LBMAG42_44970 [Deltaproteobacteria bacterium]